MTARGNLRRVLSASLALALASACGGPRHPRASLRVGYFPNLTHSQALIGLARGDFAQALGPEISLEARAFNAGPSVIEAIFAGQLDLAYIGPNPAVNGYVQSQGEALRVVAGATSGGAAFVVRPDSGIHSAEDLRGWRIASPQLGNTQDVALRAYLAAHDLRPTEQGGTVEIVPTTNPNILDLFRRGEIDGAWVPEPWAARLIIEGGGELLLDERTLWPDGQFSTALIVVRTPYLEEHPDLVQRWLEAHVRLTLWEEAHPQQAMTLANQEIARLTGQALSPAVLESAWSRLSVTYDPLTDTIQSSAHAAHVAGYLERDPDLSGLVDLEQLHRALATLDLPPLP